MNEKLIKKWSQTGLLEDIPEYRKLEIAKAFEIAANYLATLHTTVDSKEIFSTISKIISITNLSEKAIEFIISDILADTHKPNRKQIAIAKLIESQANFWQTTNDINSPTHTCDISEIISNLVTFNEISQEEAHKLENILNDLYYFIKNLKN